MIHSDLDAMIDDIRMGDAFEGSEAEWAAYVAERERIKQLPPPPPRNPKLGPAPAGPPKPDPFAIEDGDGAEANV